MTISGPSQVDENSSGDYTCTAHFSDGSDTDVTYQATWSENSSYTTISSSGRLSVGSLSSDKTCTVTASYTYNGVTRSASKSVTLKNVPVSKALDRVTISGPSQVDENSTGDYTCTAHFSDGRDTDVTSQASWGENTSYTTISSSGRLSVGSLSSDKTCTVTASYTYNGVTEENSKSVRLNDVPKEPDPPRPLSPGSTSQPGPEIEDLTPTLQWETGSGADYCALAISEYPHGTNYIVYNPQQLYGTSITVPSGVLEQGKRYCWNMQSRNSAGLSEVSRTLFFQIPQPPSTPTERLTNGSFSQGTSGWTLVGDFWAGTNYSHYRTSPGYAAGGVTSAGQPKNSAVGWMYQAVTIPSGATSATLSFYYNITSQETSTTAHDFLNVTIQDSAGHYLGSVRLLSNRDQASLGVYRRVSADVTSYKGQTIRVNFLATTNDTNPTVFRIDDVSLMSDG